MYRDGCVKYQYTLLVVSVFIVSYTFLWTLSYDYPVMLVRFMFASLEMFVGALATVLLEQVL